MGWFVFLKACEHASVITTPPSMAAWPAHYWLCPPPPSLLLLILFSSISSSTCVYYFPPSLFHLPSFYCLSLTNLVPLVWPIFLTQLCISFQTPVGEKKGGGFVISFSQMILAPVLSSVWIKRFEWPFFQGSWYPAGGSINWAHFSQPTLQGRPPLKRSRRKKNLRIITNVTHIAIRLHLSHIDNRHFSSPRGSKWNYGRAYVTL